MLAGCSTASKRWECSNGASDQTAPVFIRSPAAPRHPPTIRGRSRVYLHRLRLQHHLSNTDRRLRSLHRMPLLRRAAARQTTSGLLKSCGHAVAPSDGTGHIAFALLGGNSRSAADSVNALYEEQLMRPRPRKARAPILYHSGGFEPVTVGTASGARLPNPPGSAFGSVGSQERREPKAIGHVLAVPRVAQFQSAMPPSRIEKKARFPDVRSRAFSFSTTERTDVLFV